MNDDGLDGVVEREILLVSQRAFTGCSQESARSLAGPCGHALKPCRRSHLGIWRRHTLVTPKHGFLAYRINWYLNRKGSLR